MNLFHLSPTSSGTKSSQPMLDFQSSWKINFAIKTTGANKPMGSKRSEEIDSSCLFVGFPLILFAAITRGAALKLMMS